jgi:predicted AAA+ superfamily ATPase
MIIYRDVIDSIKPWLGKEKIILLTGPRQVGKTTILRILEEELKKETKTLFYACDLEIGNPLFKEPRLFINLLETELGQRPKMYVFLDEFQYIPQAGLFLKPVFDRLKDRIQFFVSGSSSLEISRNREFLTGRKIEFSITPFTFREWLGISSTYSFPNEIPAEHTANLSRFFKTYRVELEVQSLGYLNWGGYPEPAFEPLENKLLIIREIISTYLQKDIAGFLNISKLESFNHLIRLLAAQTGSLVNRNEICGTLGLNMATLNKYLTVLEGTYMFTFLAPFFSNIRKEISKMKKVYIFDTGVRRVLTQGRPAESLDEISGPDIENFVFTILKSHPEVVKLNYYRTISKSEIDFIIHVADGLIPLEVKYRPNFNRVPIAIRHFTQFYKRKVRMSIVVTRDYLGREGNVHFIPFFVLPFVKF